MKENEAFLFKKFRVFHRESSMPVGMDSILLGSIAQVKDARRILDVGTGCGLLALMCAQRNEQAKIDAIDIDPSSVREAEFNFRNSPWQERLNSKLISIQDYFSEAYDIIISNPPYFNDGVAIPESPREKARHQGLLSPSILLEKGKILLKEGGRISIIIPSSQEEDVIHNGREMGYIVERVVNIRVRKERKEKRSIIEFLKKNTQMREIKHPHSVIKEIETFVLYNNDGTPSERFLALCKDFYINF